MNPTHATLAAVAALAAAGKLRRRGSPKLEDMRVNRATVPQGTPVSVPFKVLMGAAKGGAALAKYQKAFARSPFDLRVVLVGVEDAATYRLSHRTANPQLGRLIARGLAQPWGTVTLIQRLPGLTRSRGRYGTSTVEQGIAQVQRMRETNKPEAFAIMSPFTLAHRLFDVSYTNYTTELGRVIAESVPEGIAPETGKVLEALREMVEDDNLDSLGIDEQAIRAQVKRQNPGVDEDDLEDLVWTQREDAVANQLFEVAASVVEACEVMVSGGVAETMEPVFSDEVFAQDIAQIAGDLYRDETEEMDGFLRRVFVSLACPTAAGRRVLLTDASQAMADCFATWVLSYSPTKGRGAIPWMTLTERELLRFDATAHAAKWYNANKHKRMVTERKRDAYARALAPYQKLIRHVSAQRTWSGETHADTISTWSYEVAGGLPAVMKAAVTLLKAQRVLGA